MSNISFRGLRKRVPGLRDDGPSSEVRVFKVNKDVTPGRLLRVENPGYKKLPFNRV